MASLKQINANRKNSKKSTGPVTNIGKAKVSLNAIKHGLYAEHHIAVGEDMVHFKNYVDMMLETYVIFDAISALMVKKIIEIGWRLNRFSIIETGILNMEMHGYDRDISKPLIASIKHKSFSKTIKNKMDKTSELMATAFVKDCNGGDRLMKLNTMEGRLLSRLTTLINQYLHYRNSKGKEIE